MFFLVTLPNIFQAILAAFLLSFTLSFDDVVISGVPVRPRRQHAAAGDLRLCPPRHQPTIYAAATLC